MGLGQKSGKNETYTLQVRKYIRRWKRNYIVRCILIYLIFGLAFANITVNFKLLLPVLLPPVLAVLAAFSCVIWDIFGEAKLRRACEKESIECCREFYSYLAARETRQMNVHDKLSFAKFSVLSGRYKESLDILKNIDISNEKTDTLRIYELIYAAAALGVRDFQSYEEHLHKCLNYPARGYTKEQLSAARTPEELLDYTNMTRFKNPKKLRWILRIMYIVAVGVYAASFIGLTVMLVSNNPAHISMPKIIAYASVMLVMLVIILVNLLILFAGKRRHLKIRGNVMAVGVVLAAAGFVLCIMYDEGLLSTEAYRNSQNVKQNKTEELDNEFDTGTTSNEGGTTAVPENPAVNSQPPEVKEEYDRNSIEGYYQMIYQRLGNVGMCPVASNAKGEVYASWGQTESENEGRKGTKSYSLVYDRESQNGKAALIVYYEVFDYMNAAGTGSEKEEKMLDVYAVRYEDLSVYPSGRTDWAEAGNDKYRQVTGE